MVDTALLARIRGEYLEMPGLSLTLEQAQRLFGVERMHCKAVLDELVETKFLCVKPTGAHARVVDGGKVLRPRFVKADLRAGRRIRAS